MNEKDKVRKYLMKDIIRQNWRFFWIIILFMVVVAGLLGKKKYDEYGTVFSDAADHGATRELSSTFYTGNINLDVVYTRTENVKILLQSHRAYETYISETRYDITYTDFVGLFHVITDNKSDYIKVGINYPLELNNIDIRVDADAESVMENYASIMTSLCDEIIGEDTVTYLGIDEAAEISDLTKEINFLNAKQDVIKQIFFGMIIGFVLSVTLITLIYLLDSRVKTAQGIALCLGVDLIGYFGKKDYINEYEKLRLLLDEYKAQDKPGSIINIMGLEKTDFSVAQELALEFHKSGRKILYIDIDKMSNESGLDDFILGKSNIDSIVASNDQGVDIIMRSANNFDNHIFDKDKYHEAMEVLKNKYDYIIVKTTDREYGLAGIAAAKECEFTVVVAENRRHKEEYLYKYIDTLHLFHMNCRGVIVYEPQK